MSRERVALTPPSDDGASSSDGSEERSLSGDSNQASSSDQCEDSQEAAGRIAGQAEGGADPSK